MRFEIGDEAAALRDAAEALLTGEATPAVVRAGWSDALGADPRGPVRAVWRELADAGVLGALAPEAAGGLGLDEDCLAPLLERIGWSGLPVPAAETIAVGVPLLAAAGHPALPAVLAGDALVAAQLGGGDLVPFGRGAELVLLRRGDQVIAHERGELRLEPVPAVDGSRALARLTRSPVGGVVVADGPDACAAAWRHGVLGTSALLTGLADRMLRLTVDYVKQRRQYGVPVGSFQALKHALASALLALEFARPAVLAAGWAQAAGLPDAGEQTSIAKVLASDAARLVARTAIQCHGAIGYTTEYDLHLFAKRVWALAPSWGDASRHRAELAGALGLGGPDPSNPEGARAA